MNNNRDGKGNHRTVITGVEKNEYQKKQILRI